MRAILVSEFEKKNLILNLGGETGATLQRGRGSHQYHPENCFEAIYPSQPEIDISVSKLLCFETFAKSLRVSVSVSENLFSE